MFPSLLLGCISFSHLGHCNTCSWKTSVLHCSIDTSASSPHTSIITPWKASVFQWSADTSVSYTQHTNQYIVDKCFHWSTDTSINGFFKQALIIETGKHLFVCCSEDTLVSFTSIYTLTRPQKTSVLHCSTGTSASYTKRIEAVTHLSERFGYKLIISLRKNYSENQFDIKITVKTNLTALFNGQAI